MRDPLFAPADVRDRHLEISFLSSSGTGGRPFRRDFHRQNKRNPFRCQRMSVSGFTTMREFLHSKSLARVTIVNRVELSVRRGVCSRSIKNVSCFRRKRFSAARALRERRRFRANARASRTTGTIFESKRKNGPFRIKGDEPDDGRRETADSGRSNLNCGINVGSSFCGPQACSNRELKMLATTAISM